MVDLRIYRAALIPAVLALVIAAFSLVDPPGGYTTTLAPDAFLGERAFATLEGLAERFPAREPGSAGDQRLAQVVETTFRGTGMEVRRFAFRGQTAVGRRDLETVVGERPGVSDHQVVVIAHRDALGSPATAELSGTAALLELAKVFEGRRLNKTLILASTSGGSAGAAGTRELVRRLTGPVDGVLVLGDLAGARVRRPMVVPWSDGLGIASRTLRSTVERAVEQETGERPGATAALAQLPRFAVPLTTGEQGAATAEGRAAVLLQRSGERGPQAGTAVSEATFSAMGRAALRSISALDGAPPVELRPRADFRLRGKNVPGWAVRALVGALLLAPLVVAIDGLARASRRRRTPVRWLAWTLSGAAPFLLALLIAHLLRLTGLIEAAPPAAAPAGAVPLGGAGWAALGIVLAALVAGWMLLRPLLLTLAGGRGDITDPAAGTALLLVMTVLAAAVWVFNPYAAGLLVIALHLWVLVLVPELRVRRAVAVAVVVVGLAPLALVIAYYAVAFGYDAIEVPWNALLLAVGGAIGPAASIAWCFALGCAASMLAIALRATAARPAPPPTTRGPVSYAGPGSLGGTESALRR